MGFCHGANEAFARVLDHGVCTSVSVIVNTPWLDEAVAIADINLNGLEKAAADIEAASTWLTTLQSSVSDMSRAAVNQ